MLTRQLTSSRPQLVFTRDYHEFARGRVEPGATCTINYDPARIVPPESGYIFGHPDEAIVAHLQFQAGGPILDLPLESWSGISSHTASHRHGQGAMLRATFTVPDDASWITVWFTYHPAQGETRYDSDYGRNHQIRFHHELRLVEASVRGAALAALHSFHCLVEADPQIERITAVYRCPNVRGSEHQPHEQDLRRLAGGKGGTARWELDGAPVPHGAVVVFELLYDADGGRHIDNNQGHYFLAVHAEGLEPIPST